MYTRGTTGRPKGALLTHRAVTANLAQFMVAMEATFGERWLLVVPMPRAYMVGDGMSSENRWSGSTMVGARPFPVGQKLTDVSR